MGAANVESQCPVDAEKHCPGIRVTVKTFSLTGHLRGTHLEMLSDFILNAGDAIPDPFLLTAAANAGL
jgi:hypothetical protein